MSKGIMAKGKVMDIKRETKSDRKISVRKSDNNAVQHNRSNVQSPDNVQDLQTQDNPEVEKTVGKRLDMKKVDPVFGCRQTVIRNLPQLQKLDNVAVSSEEMVSLFQR